MARVKLTEYRAKTLLTKNYDGVGIKLPTAEADVEALNEHTKYVIKVDQGVKKRGKQGLIRLNVTKKTALAAVQELAERGYSQFLAEPMVPHDSDEERYVSIERVRGGLRVLYSDKGGMDIEDHLDDIQSYDGIEKVPLPQDFLESITNTMTEQHMCFVEINPLVVRGDECILLDAAALVDSAGYGYVSWQAEDVAEIRQLSDAEKVVSDLNDGSAASFSFRLLNPNGALWLLLSGGGASITLADEAANRNKAELIGNYGEYSGGPTREEVRVYTAAVIKQALQSKAPSKAIIIAGGVANFTDVKKTFAGIIDVLQENMNELKKANIKVYVRRGGPNELEGLAMMESFLKTNGILGSVHGSKDVLTTVVDQALEYVNA